MLVWPENRTALAVFQAMRTQWRVGINGRTGLDYAALPEVWRRCGVSHSQRDDVFNDLQFLELAALAAMNED